MPLVSVIIPAYNAAAYIRKTLESVVAQTYREIEAIVVDDGSTDGTADIAEAFAREHPRIRVLRHVNGGVGAARNIGISHAQGTYVAPLDADDLWYPQKIADQVACMEAHGERTGLVYCWTNLHRQDDSVLRPCGMPRFEGDVVAALIAGNFMNCASVPLFRMAALKEVGGYVTRAEQNGAQGCEDYDLSMRIAEKYEVYCVPKYLVGYRQTGGMSVNARPMHESFTIVQRRARVRNPAMPRRYFRWSAAGFYCWLGGRCYAGGNFGWCLRSMVRVIVSDPSYLLYPTVYKLTVKCILRIVLGGPVPPDRIRSVDPNVSPSLPESLFLRIHANRFARVTAQSRY